jgi:predicted phospho-2-dehydro-3-deoxyheptonate aldolase
MQGKENRLKRLYRHSNRLFIVAMDHGTTLGPVEGLVDIRNAVKSVFDGNADAVVVHKGMVRYLGELLGPASGELIVHVSASTSLSPSPDRKELVSSVEHAIRLGATAVSIHVNMASNYEADMLKDLGKIAEECDLWGMPLLAMMYVRDGSKESEYDPAKIKHAARVAEELGVDIVKVNYTGSPDTFVEVTGGVNIPVVIAGGPKMASRDDVLAMVQDAVGAGASGVSIGRNVFQDPDPAQFSKAIRRILDRDSQLSVIERR